VSHCVEKEKWYHFDFTATTTGHCRSAAKTGWKIFTC